MPKDQLVKIFREVNFLIESSTDNFDVNEKIRQISQESPEDFFQALTKKSENEGLKDDWDEFSDTIMHAAARKGNLEILITISEIYIKNSFFTTSTPKKISKISRIANILLYREIDNLKISSPSIQPLLDLKARNGDPIIHQAIWNKHFHIVNWLMENGANVNILDGQKRNLLHIAIHVDVDKFYLPLVEKLHQKLDLNAQDNSGFTILCYLVKKRRLKLVKKLLNLGADINCHNSNKIDALIIAVSINNFKIVEILLDHAAERNIRLINLEKAISLAKKNQSATEISKILAATLESYRLQDANSIDQASIALFASIKQKNISKS